MQTTSRQDAISIGAPKPSRTADGRWRVDADVDGTEAFLIADDPLVANGDAWASAMLLPAAKSGATLRVEADLDARLHANFAGIQKLAGEYWGFKGAHVSPRRLVARAPAGRDAMFFTCGVDSFYTLKKRRETVTRLIFVRGLNSNLLDLDDARLFAQARHGIESVAHELGIPAIFVETNLRTHPTFSRVGWDVSHVAALACVAHAMAPVVSRAYLASTDNPAPWGSRPELDPLWTSNAVEIVNDGSEAVKLDKIRAIADWPLVHRFLRVCYQSRDGALNCGVCGKCVRTQLQFAIAGARERLETFPQAPLVDLIDGIKWITADQHFRWKPLIPHVRDPAIVAAITRLIARRPSAIERLRRKALWLRRSAAGRRLRDLAKRMLVR